MNENFKLLIGIAAFVLLVAFVNGMTKGEALIAIWNFVVTLGSIVAALMFLEDVDRKNPLWKRIV